VNYYWLDCPGCHCHVATSVTVYPDRISGSLRRWSQDRSVNDGRKFDVSAADRRPDGSFSVPCVCGKELSFSAEPSAVGGDRDENLRVTLG
jgi:hypothetical protein